MYGVAVICTNFVMFFFSHRYVDPSEDIIKKKLNHGKRKPTVSCILAVHNEENIITDCIQSILDTDYENKEIIVVNDASTDHTLEVLQRFSNQRNITIIDLHQNVGKKKAIGKGIRIAKGEVFVFTDSDSILAKDSISRIMEIFIHDKNVGAVSGHGRALNSDTNLITKIQDSWYEGQFSVKKAFESFFGTVTCISGPLAVFRREAIFNYIPAWENDSFLGQEFRFSTDRTMTGFVLGSKEIGPKLKQKYKDDWFVKHIDYPIKKWKLLYCKSAKVWTQVPDKFSTVIKQQVRWKKSFIRNIFFTGKFFWRKPLIPALRYYLGVLFVLAGPFIVFRQMIFMPLNGDYLSAVYYLFGVLFIGSLYSIAYKLEIPNCHKWVYRPFMSILSTLVFSWLIFYSFSTIKKNIWHRG